RWRTLAFNRCSLFCRHILPNRDPAVEYSLVMCPPYLTFTSSTYSINASAVSLPICSYRLPPKSLVILYLPSEKAPAPPKPDIMEQVLHFIHVFTFLPSM